MKDELKKLSLKLASKVILSSAKTEANSSCFFIGQNYLKMQRN